MIQYIVVLLLCTTTCIALLSIPRIVELYRTARHLKLTVNDSYLPDYVIEKEQPIRFPVGEQYLLLQPLSAQKYEYYVDKMISFFQRYQNYLRGVNIDRKFDEMESESVTNLISLFKKDEARTDFMKIVSKTILSDRSINPLKIRLRYLRRNLTFTQLIQLFIVLYDRNITSVESFIRCLMEQLESGVANAKSGCGLWSLQNLKELTSQIGQLQDNPCGSLGGRRGNIGDIKSLKKSKIKKVVDAKSEDVLEDV